MWLLEIAVAALDWFKPDSAIGRQIAFALRRHLRARQYEVKYVALLLALSRLEAPPLRHMPPHPQGGYFVRAARSSTLRLFTRNVFHRMRPMNLRAHVARLRDAIENIDAWADRLAKRIKRTFSMAPRVLAAPPVERTYSDALIEVAAADSS